MIRVVSCIVLMMAACYQSHVQAADIIRFATSPSWGMPYFDESKSLNTNKGIVVDIIDALSKELKQPMQELSFSRKRLASAVESGEVQLWCFASRKWVENPDKFQWSGTIFKVKDIIVLHNSVSNIKTINDLKGLRIGTVIGFYYSKEIEQGFANKTLIREDAPDIERTLKKLLLHRSDAAIVAEPTLLWYNREKKYSFSSQTIFTDESDVECAMPINLTIDSEPIFTAIKKLKQNGSIDAILKRYQ